MTTPTETVGARTFHRPAATGPAYWGPRPLHLPRHRRGVRRRLLAMEALVLALYGRRLAHPHARTRRSTLEGQLEFRLGEQTITAGPGDFVNVTRGLVHNFKNVGDDTARMAADVHAGRHRALVRGDARACAERCAGRGRAGQPRGGRGALRRHRVPLRHRVRLRRSRVTVQLPDASSTSFRLVPRDPEHRARSAHAPDVTRAAEWVADYVRRLGGEAEVREEGRLIVSEIPARRAPRPSSSTATTTFSRPTRSTSGRATFAAEPRGEWLQRAASPTTRASLDAAEGDRVARAGRRRPGDLPRRLRRRGGDRRRCDPRFLDADDGPVDACVCLDGWMKTRNTPELVVATRGLVALDVDVQTGDRDLHSGHYGGTALNAIHALATALTALFPENGRLPGAAARAPAHLDDDELAGWPSAAPARTSSPASAPSRSTSVRPRSSTSARSWSPRST